MNEELSALLFEDDRDLARQWLLKLREKGVKVRHAWTVESAIEYCNKMKFDVIICDIFLQDNTGKPMPRGGITLLNYLRVTTPLEKRPPWTKSVPILVVTGSPKHSGFDVLDITESIGGTMSMRKPFSADELAENVFKLLAS